jgi:hypothetical protein
LHTRDPQHTMASRDSDNRSKFNVAPGIEAQGFCVLK